MTEDGVSVSEGGKALVGGGGGAHTKWIYAKRNRDERLNKLCQHNRTISFMDISPSLLGKHSPTPAKRRADGDPVRRQGCACL